MWSPWERENIDAHGINNRIVVETHSDTSPHDGEVLQQQQSDQRRVVAYGRFVVDFSNSAAEDGDSDNTLLAEIVSLFFSFRYYW